MITFTPDREFLTLGLFIPNGDLISPIIIVQTPGSLTGTTNDSFSQRVRNLKKYMVRVSRSRVRELRRRGEIKGNEYYPSPFDYQFYRRSEKSVNSLGRL